MRSGGSTGLLTGVVGLLAVVDLVRHVGPPRTSLLLDPAAHLLVLPSATVGLPAQRRRAAAEDERTRAVR
ncbi:MAG: hypothetical protein QOC93_2559 [Actinomycetota bacterium]|nr:hypothetical protein [Actinomycetota bacterium]